MGEIYTYSNKYISGNKEGFSCTALKSEILVYSMIIRLLLISDLFLIDM